MPRFKLHDEIYEVTDPALIYLVRKNSNYKELAEEIVDEVEIQPVVKVRLVKKHKGWPKGKPRGPRKQVAEKPEHEIETQPL